MYRRAGLFHAYSAVKSSAVRVARLQLTPVRCIGCNDRETGSAASEQSGAARTGITGAALSWSSPSMSQKSV
jgi:hypothetical protein